MIARSFDELRVYGRATTAANAVSAIARRPCFSNDSTLRHQLLSASGSVPAQIAEGFGQATDRHFAHYLYVARGAANEVRAHLTVAVGRGLIAEPEWKTLSAEYNSIGRMLTTLVRYLRASDRKIRG